MFPRFPCCPVPVPTPAPAAHPPAGVPFSLHLQIDAGPGQVRMAGETVAAALSKLLPADGRAELIFFGVDPLRDLDALRRVAAAADDAAARRGIALPRTLVVPRAPFGEGGIAFIAARIDRLTMEIDVRSADAGESLLASLAEVLAPLPRNGIPYGLRLTLGEDLAGRLEPLVVALAGLGAEDLGVVPRFGALPWRRHSRLAWIDGTMRLTRAALADLPAGERPKPDGHLGPVAAHLLEGVRRTHPCAAGDGMFAVSAGGDVYPCPRFFDAPDFLMGNVHDWEFPGARFTRVAERLQLNSADYRPKCANCRIRDVCGGECPARCLRRRGDIALPSTDHCDLTKRIVRETDELLAAVLAGPGGPALRIAPGAPESGCPAG